MTFDTVFFLATIPAVLFAGISKGGFASGAAFAATPFLALVMSPDLAVGLMLPLLLVMDVTSLKPFWGQWDRESTRVLMLTTVPGVGLGVLLFHWADPNAVKLMIGVISIGFVAYQLARARGWFDASPRPFSFGEAALAGIAAGFTSFVSHAGGPPAAIYLLRRNISKRSFQATSVIVFFWVNVIKVPPFLALGLIRSDTLLATLMLAPVAIVGTLIGVWAHEKLPERPFFVLIYLFLTITGAKLIYDAIV